MADDYRILARSTDMIHLSWLQALLRDAGIECLVFDRHASIIEGSIGAIPQRLMVPASTYERAVSVLRDAGESAHLAESQTDWP